MIAINTQTQADLQRSFTQGGLISRFLPGFEQRPQQIQMADAIRKAFAANQHLVVEAGTGVGKSFAYLIPAIELIGKNAGITLISTYTITLQEQLIKKDIPFLAKCVPDSFSAVLAKGRANYLCKRRLEFAASRQKYLFNRYNYQLDAVYQWSKTTKDGSLSDLTFIPNGKIWDAVNSEHGNCRSRKCPHFKNCFYQRARRKLDYADIIVANHSLLFSDLVLKEQQVSLLPDYNQIIIDEAHNIEHVAESHFGLDISERKIKFMLDDLYNPKTKKGLLAYKSNEKTIELLDTTAKQTAAFFKQISYWYEQTKHETNGRCQKNFVDDRLTQYLKELRTQLATMSNSTDDADEKLELTRYVNRAAVLAKDTEAFLQQNLPENVYWVEPTQKRKHALHLKSAPINVAGQVKQCLFDKYQSVILTSATLSTGSENDKKGFEFFTSRIGLEKFKDLKLGSPFDYSKQVTVYIEKDLPNPNDKNFIAPAAGIIKKYLLKTSGRAFVLFTSYSMLRDIAIQLRDWLKENNFELLQQGEELDRTTLLKKFKTDNKSVLFGTDSFWQGVDVPGPALSNVIIVKLPFAVPDQPLIAGRIEKLKEQGKNPFYEYQLPSAIIKFKQGFGRLIRTKKDKGIVVILDSRIIHKAYGQKFLNAIPNCNITISKTEQSKD